MPRPEQLRNENKLINRGLSAEQQDLMTYSVDPVWIYNVGFLPHSKFFHGMGQVSIPGAKNGKPECITLNKRVAFAYDKGDRKQGFIVHHPKEIAEDFLGISTFGDKHPTTNLTLQGCFMTLKPLEELPAKEREALLTKAQQTWDDWCQAKVSEADSYYSITQQRVCISEIHKQACLYLDSRGLMLAREHPWVGRSNSSAIGITECPWCGSPIKKTVKKCPHCLEYTSPEHDPRSHQPKNRQADSPTSSGT